MKMRRFSKKYSKVTDFFVNSREVVVEVEVEVRMWSFVRVGKGPFEITLSVSFPDQDLFFDFDEDDFYLSSEERVFDTSLEVLDYLQLAEAQICRLFSELDKAEERAKDIEVNVLSFLGVGWLEVEK